MKVKKHFKENWSWYITMFFSGIFSILIHNYITLPYLRGDDLTLEEKQKIWEQHNERYCSHCICKPSKAN